MIQYNKENSRILLSVKSLFPRLKRFIATSLSLSGLIKKYLSAYTSFADVSELSNWTLKTWLKPPSPILESTLYFLNTLLLDGIITMPPKLFT